MSIGEQVRGNKLCKSSARGQQTAVGHVGKKQQEKEMKN
jgi:hypothetical protein